jgi:DNA repair exonuclease SbcCD ATPase subunit
MEKFIASIAIRNALMLISTKPKPNYFIIDEGFSNLDATNLAQLYLLFNYLRNQYDLILIISHNDTIKDFVDDLIVINKNNDGSFIKF